jgi:hypothetical protein
MGNIMRVEIPNDISVNDILEFARNHNLNTRRDCFGNILMTHRTEKGIRLLKKEFTNDNWPKPGNTQ